MKRGKKFILVIYGPSCGGKTSAVELLMSKHENLFRSSQDKIKWLISNYDRNKHTHIVNKLLMGLTKNAIAEGFSLVVEGGLLVMKNKGRDFRLMAKRNKMNFFEFNIEAPFGIVKERLKTRIKEARMKKIRISNKSMKRFNDLYTLYKENKNEKIHTFDSSILSTKEIVEEIGKRMGLS